jgi:seryl-tRNA synthetase
MQDVLFSEAIPLAFKEDLERRVFYLSEDIEDFHLIVSGAGVEGVRVSLGRKNGSSANEVRAKIMAAGDTYKRCQPPVKAKRIWFHTGAMSYLNNAFEQMAERSLAFQTSRGLVAVSEPVMVLTHYFDRQITALVKQVFAAVEYQYPTLMTSEALRRSGCMESFPQLMMYVTRLHSDGVADGQHYRSADLCLPPTMCYHVYDQFADATFDCQPGRVVTAKGKAFRFESKYEKNMERLWDFTIREVVFLGTPEFVAEQRRRLMAESFALFEEWQLTGYCETASDPFFTPEGEASNGFMQRLMALKYELRLNLEVTATIAVASFNLHNDFFGRAFNIRHPDGKHIRTACAGFGLERLVFAFLCQHGLDPAGWPSNVRAAITSNETC